MIASNAITNAKPPAAHSTARGRRFATRTPPTSSASTSQGSQVPTATVSPYATCTIGSWSDWTNTMFRSTGGIRAATVMPRSTRPALTCSTIGPSGMPREPSSLIVATAAGSLDSVAISWVWPIRSDSAQAASNWSDATNSVTPSRIRDRSPLTAVLCRVCRAAVARGPVPSAISPSTQLLGQIVEVDLGVDGGHGLVDDVRLHLRTARERCVGRDEPLRVRQRPLRPPGDDGHRGQQDAQQDEHDRQHGAGPARWRTGRRLDRRGSQRGVLGFQGGHAGLQVLGHGRST